MTSTGENKSGNDSKRGTATTTGGIAGSGNAAAPVEVVLTYEQMVFEARWDALLSV
jgi:hypothetical protein